MDEDLTPMDRGALIAEVTRLRAGIRKHRDSSGHDLCWHHPELWGLLPEQVTPEIAVPPWDKFMRGCVAYRRALELELPNAPKDEHDFAASTDKSFSMSETRATARLLLRRPTLADAEVIFDRYAADPEVTRYLGWPRHQSVEDSRAFIALSDREWAAWGTGPFLILEASSGRLLGSTGLHPETRTRASTGYVLARDAWGQGYATEALAAMVDLGRDAGIVRLQALCHTDHTASARVLEKGGFALEGLLRRHSVFPQLDPTTPMDALLYAILP